MKRRVLQTARVAAILGIVIVVITFLLSAIWTGGVHGRDGDLVLGVYPGQLRIGWSQDWKNDGNWARVHVTRSSEAPQLGFLGGNTFTSAAPFEVAVDFPLWLCLVPLVASAVYLHRRIARLPSGPVCRRCGYPIGVSSRCSECGAPLGRSVA